MPKKISESRFYMWRAVVAMVHADGVVTPHELSFINDHLKDLELSADQLQIIGTDLQEPQDIYEMFSHIQKTSDKTDFFALARAVSWCDGDYATQEKHIISQLEDSFMNSENRQLLVESRKVMNEVELCGMQWNFKTERSKSLFGFLNKRNKVGSV